METTLVAWCVACYLIFLFTAPVWVCVVARFYLQKTRARKKTVGFFHPYWYVLHVATSRVLV